MEIWSHKLGARIAQMRQTGLFELVGCLERERVCVCVLLLWLLWVERVFALFCRVLRSRGSLLVHFPPACVVMDLASYEVVTYPDACCQELARREAWKR